LIASTYLNEVLTLGLGDKRLELGGGEGIDETGLGDNEQQHLSAGEDGKLISLFGRPTDRVSHAKYRNCVNVLIWFQRPSQIGRV
jgi:hypothetical protein